MLKDGSENGLRETSRPFQGNPTFAGGYPKDFADKEYAGRYAYPQQAIEPKMHWRGDWQTRPPSPYDYEGGREKYKGPVQEKLEVDYYSGQYVSPSKEADDAVHLVNDKADHFIRDYNDPTLKNKSAVFGDGRRKDTSFSAIDSKSHSTDSIRPVSYREEFDDKAAERSGMFVNQFNTTQPVFSGSTTLVNPEGGDNFSEKNQIMLINGLETAEKENVRAQNIVKGGKTDQSKGDTTKHNHVNNHVPLTPLHPFTRIDEYKGGLYTATKKMLFRTYNRTHMPVADAEFRKGFRHIFFNRPECYVMYADNGKPRLCQQAEKDEDFYSLYQRLPHVVELLAPSYVTGTSSTSDYADRGEKFFDNWNYLLSNRVLSMDIGEEQLSTKETISKSAEGYTVMPGLHFESRTGSTISITFRDTKDLEVYEFLKAWMLYIHKRARGYFAPPYYGYQYENQFYPTNRTPTRIGKTYKSYGMQLHPYDRALEYGASIFDFATNECDNKIIYWCKYFGVYPVSVSSPISNENNGPLSPDSMKITATFRYQYKLPGSNKSLVEFNYNSGICNEFGHLSTARTPKCSMPFIHKNRDDDLRIYPQEWDGYDPCYALAQAIGAAGMFTGTPMILYECLNKNPMRENGDDTDLIVHPVLRFADINDPRLNELLNLGYNNVVDYGSKLAAQNQITVENPLAAGAEIEPELTSLRSEFAALHV